MYKKMVLYRQKIIKRDNKMKMFKRLSELQSHIILFCLLILLSFFSVRNYNIHYKQSVEKINSQSGKITAEAIINSFPETEDGETKAQAKIIKCSVKDFENLNFLMKFPEGKDIISCGDTISVTGTVEKVFGASNPGSFDYKEYLKSLNVSGIFTSDDENVKILSRRGFLLDKIYSVRDRFIKTSDMFLSPSASGTLRAVVGGDRTDISPDDEDNFKKSGVYHIVAISGLHLSIFIYAAYGAIRRLNLKRKYKAILSVITCLVIGCFVLVFTGFGVSLIRAFLMSSILSFASLVPRHYSSKTALFLTGFLMIIFMPYCFYSTSFALSFLSTLGVLVAFDFIKYLKERDFLTILWGNYLGTTFCVSVFTSLFTLPVTVGTFGYIPLLSWITNALILPVMPALLGAGSVFAAVSGFAPLWILKAISGFISGTYIYISWVVKSVAHVEKAVLDIYPADAMYFGITLISFIILSKIFFKHGMKKAFCTLLIFAVALGGFLVYNNRDTDNLEIVFADVGQGECCLISQGKTSVLIDSGTSGETDFCTSSVEAMLRHKNIKMIDAAIVTHYHSDHANIMEKLLSDGKIRKLMLPEYYNPQESEAEAIKEKLIYAALSSNTEIVYVKSGAGMSFDSDMKIEFLLPGSDMYFDNNNMSLITRLVYGENSVLLCGDAEEKEIEKLADYDIDSDIIKIPHHGGYCDNLKDLIDKSSPEYAVISCSKYNLYNHPDKRVLNILKDENIKTKRTDQSGAVIFTLDKDRIISVKEMR